MYLFVSFSVWVATREVFGTSGANPHIYPLKLPMGTLHISHTCQKLLTGFAVLSFIQESSHWEFTHP